ncbi:MAG: hypothetical protein Ct9H300mP19_05060 [Dehalococcoidia bacterium]|nr:MAG: hypothetical protein Ct9H300mP19_05060 [Dehalococcoidia bacterium]
MMLLVSATELITIYVALELSALPIVALAAIHRTKQGIEAGTKFLYCLLYPAPYFFMDLHTFMDMLVALTLR